MGLQCKRGESESFVPRSMSCFMHLCQFPRAPRASKTGMCAHGEGFPHSIEGTLGTHLHFKPRDIQLFILQGADVKTINFWATTRRLSWFQN